MKPTYLLAVLFSFAPLVAMAQTPSLVPVLENMTSAHDNLVPVRSLVRMAIPDRACNRSDSAWPARPIKIAVLDFAYPGAKKATSGTVVADLVYGRLEGDRLFVVSRGDRRRIEYDDFAGAASVGRRLGVDAVLAGAWERDEAIAPGVRTSLVVKTPRRKDPMRIAAGLVDSCTGELLMKLTSDPCTSRLGMGGAPNPRACTTQPLSLAAATNPRSAPMEVGSAIDRLVSPLEPLRDSSNLVVAKVDGSILTLTLPRGAGVKVGDELSVRASRLGKNSSTYTLHTLQNEEVGRMVVQRVSEGSAAGTFSGDYLPMAGDVAAR